MSTPYGYNNPAYCHQYDSSLYDYQYVPEIDPDSPDLDEESNRKQSNLIRPNSEEFEVSDESNGSIIIEECNNRRVTLICEKRNQTEGITSEFPRDGKNYKSAYYQDVSLESENGYDHRGNESHLEREPRQEGRVLRHQRPLEPAKEQKNMNGANWDCSIINNNEKILHNQQPQRHHRYEEISGDEDCLHRSLNTSTSVHRYAEISVDENGYPTLKKPIEIQKSVEGIQVISKPRAISPIDYSMNFSPTRTRSQTHQRTPYSKVLEYSPSQRSRNSPSQTQYSSSPMRKNSYEMAELSPPRSTSQRARNEQTFFIDSPKRQPPIGASASNDSQDPFLLNARCILPSHLQKNTSKSRRERSHSAPNSPKRTRDFNHLHFSPGKAQFDKRVMQIFHKAPKSKTKTMPRETMAGGRENSARRNISNFFTDSPLTPRKRIDSTQIAARSPYKPTTMEIGQPKTAIITPIFQRKNQQNQGQINLSCSPPKRNFEKMSQTFQSTGNLFGTAKDQNQVNSKGIDYRLNIPNNQSFNQSRMKRNQSVPNFAHTFTVENGLIARKSNEMHPNENHPLSKNINFQYSPKKTLENMSPVAKSRMSLINQSRSSWSYADSDVYPRCSTCFIIATIVHLITATATCAISFYLLSKIGRKYYLDFGILAGFVNFILGLLGFRSYCWRWLPNRNYVSGFIGLAAFSTFTCVGLSYLIMVKPMAGDPILDIMGGAICAVSVLTILLALTGLTMSGCCKTPPPDNRVTDL